MTFDSAIVAANTALAEQGCGLRVERRGQKLNLRGRLPCRQQPNQWKTQRLSLGLLADLNGLKEAERIVQLVELQLQRQLFAWDQWLPKQKIQQYNTPQGESTSVTHPLDRDLETFKNAFFADPRRRRSPRPPLRLPLHPQRSRPRRRPRGPAPSAHGMPHESLPCPRRCPRDQIRER